MDATEQADTEAPTTEDSMSGVQAETTQAEPAQSDPNIAAAAQSATVEADNTSGEPQPADEPLPQAFAEAQPEPAEMTAKTQPDPVDTPPEVTAEAPAEMTAEVTAEAPAEMTAEAPAEVTAEAPAAMTAQVPETASGNPQDAAEDRRPLGAADEMADMVDQAVDRMNEATAEERIDGAAADASARRAGEDVDSTTESAASAMTDEGGPADDTATTEMTAEPADGNGAAPAEAAEAAEAAQPAEAAEAAQPAEAAAPAEAAEATAPTPPAPRVYEGPEPTTMEELLAEQSTEIRSLKHGDVVEGSVVRVDKDEILVDIGAKSEGVISNRELYGRNAESQPALNIGDVVLVYVLQPESPEGHAVLSLRRAGLERKWRSMQEQLDAGAIIEAPVIDHNKGGLIVDCGIRGFVPISQIVDFPRRPQNEQPRDAAQEIAEKLQPYVGRKLRLKILEVNRKANRLILSEKVALYEERREKRDELFSSLQVGQKVTGTVRSIAPFGVFVDLGGIDGLVHKSELSWNKVNNPEAGYRVGEEVEAEVIDINHERGRISLSIRRLQPDPWHSTVADLKVGDLIDGTVTKIVNFGSFVRVRDGLEGLIHISELSHQRVNHPGDVVHEGQTLKLKIISLDQERHRLGLSLKQAEEAPARPEPSASTPSSPRERRPRQDRGGGYDMSQAVQEPEGGIDNTLAAAFAQVRQQMEETEAARGSTDEPVDTSADAMVEMPSAETTDESAEAEAKPARKSRAASKGKAEPAADDEAVPSADEPTAEAAAPEELEPAPAPKPEAKAKKSKASAKPADEPAPEIAEASVADPASDPAEGAADAAPAEGADREESADEA